MIPILVGLKPNQTNHGPICNFDCPSCNRNVNLNLISEKLTLKIWFIPIGTGDGAWSLKCSKCGAEFVLSETDAGHAMDMGQYFAKLTPDEQARIEVEDLLEDHPVEALRKLLKSNTNWKCPKCGSEVPDTMNSCWNCQYTFA